MSPFRQKIKKILLRYFFNSGIFICDFYIFIFQLSVFQFEQLTVDAEICSIKTLTLVNSEKTQIIFGVNYKHENLILFGFTINKSQFCEKTAKRKRFVKSQIHILVKHVHRHKVISEFFVSLPKS